MKNPRTGKRWKLYMGLPSNGTVCDFQGYTLRDLVERYSDDIEFIFPEHLCQRIFHDAAREGIVQDFMDSGADILWFLDSDIAPPKHVLDLITTYGDKWLTAAAPYPVFMAAPGEDIRQILFTIYKDIGKCPKTGKVRVAPDDCPMEGTKFVAGAATGCLFIKREVFEKLERPYFEFKYDPITRTPIEGEDIGFIMKMVGLKIPCFVDFNSVCKHFKNNIDLLEMNNYAMYYAQRCVNAQDARMKDMLKIVEQKYNALKQTNKQLREALQQAMVVAENARKRDPGRPLIYK